MRKRNCDLIFDNLMWYFIYLLPLICFVFMVFHSGVDGVTLSTTMTSCGLGIFTDNVIYNSLTSLFGVEGVLPFFNNTDIIAYLSYFVCVFFVHLAVDVLLFIPRWAHNFISKCGGKNA